MDTSDDCSSFKEYEPPPPSASGVATRCEMPAQPLVGNLGNWAFCLLGQSRLQNRNDNVHCLVSNLEGLGMSRFIIE